MSKCLDHLTKRSSGCAHRRTAYLVVMEKHGRDTIPACPFKTPRLKMGANHFCFQPVPLTVLR